jgi:hypothetical protein
MSLYDTVIDVVLYEWNETRDQYDSGHELQLEQTARQVWRYLAKRNTLRQIRAMPEQWQREESAHLATLDYFSSFEMITT